MSIQNMLMIFLLLTSLLTTVAALHYKNSLDALKTEQQRTHNNTLILATQISLMARDIRIATYPTACDALTKKVIGEECDLGNYMEWAGPHLEEETERLLLLLKTK